MANEVRFTPFGISDILNTPGQETCHNETQESSDQETGEVASADKTLMRGKCDQTHKKRRVFFTRDQVSELEKAFRRQRFLSAPEREELARVLDMTPKQIKTWFQNRRYKYKKQQRDLQNDNILAHQKAFIRPCMQQEACFNYVRSLPHTTHVKNYATCGSYTAAQHHGYRVMACYNFHGNKSSGQL